MYLNLKALSVKQLLGVPLPGAQMLDVALTSSDALRELFPPNEQSELLRARLSLRDARTVTLDLHETGEMLLPDDARVFVHVIREHWRACNFCLCHADAGVFEPWRGAALQEQQPLVLWRHWNIRGGYLLLAPPIRGLDLMIFRALVQTNSASSYDLARNPTIVPQRWPFYSPHALTRLIAMGRQVPTRGGPSPTDESEVKRSLRHLLDNR